VLNSLKIVPMYGRRKYSRYASNVCGLIVKWSNWQRRTFVFYITCVFKTLFPNILTFFISNYPIHFNMINPLQWRLKICNFNRGSSSRIIQLCHTCHVESLKVSYNYYIFMSNFLFANLLFLASSKVRNGMAV